MTDGKLVNAYIHNNNDKSMFIGFEIVTCRELSDYNGGTIIEEVKTIEEYLNADELALDEPFYRIFGIYRNKIWNSSSSQQNTPTQKRAIADFFDPKEAAKFLQELTGHEVNIYSV